MADFLSILKAVRAMPERRRVAFMLDLELLYKRHAEVFAGAQRYAEEHGWDSIIDEFVHDTLATKRAGKRVPYDGIIARASSALLKQTTRVRIPVVNVWVRSPVRDRVPGVFPDMHTGGELAAEHLLTRGGRSFAMLASSGSHAQEVFHQTEAWTGFGGWLFCGFAAAGAGSVAF